MRSFLTIYLISILFCCSGPLTHGNTLDPDSIIDRLDNCRNRFPDQNAYEYSLLDSRARQIEKNLEQLNSSHNTQDLENEILDLMDALEGQLDCRETEGWNHAPLGKNDTFILPPGCENWNSNLPMVIRESDHLPAHDSPSGEAQSGWTTDKKIELASDVNTRPDITTRANGNLVCATITESYTIRNVSLFESSDCGLNWTFLTSYEAGTDDCDYPAIAVDVYTDTIYVVFQRESNSNEHQIQGFSYLSGTVTGFTIDMDSGDDIKPRIACEYSYNLLNYLYVSYEHITNENNCEVHVARSMDHGATWSEWHNRGYGGNLEVHQDTDICVSNNGNVFLTYVKGADSGSLMDLYVEFGSRGDTSAQFANQVEIYDALTNGARSAAHPSITGSHDNGNNLIIAWERQRPDLTHTAIYCSYTLTGGLVWTNALISADTDRLRKYPDVSVDGIGSSSTSIDGNFHCAWYHGDDSSCRYKIADQSTPDTWASWDDGTINKSTITVTDCDRFAAVTTQLREDGNWYPCITYSAGNVSNAYHTTKRARNYLIEGSLPAYIVKVDGVSYSWGNGVFNNWPMGISHTIFAPDNPPMMFQYWSDGGAQSHVIWPEGGVGEVTITAYFHNPTATPTNTPTPTPTPACPYENQILYENHEDGDDWGETSGPVWTQDSDDGCLVVERANALDPGSVYVGRLNPGNTVSIPVDTTGFTSIRLLVHLNNYNFEAGDYSFISVSTDGGSTFNPLAIYNVIPWTDITLDLTDLLGATVENNPDVQISFANSAFEGGKLVFVDNIVMLGCTEPTATPTDTPIPTNTPEPTMTPTITPTPFGQIIGEMGNIRVTHEWSPIILENTYNDPVVVCGAVGKSYNDIVSVRVRNITSDSFECRLAETEPCLDGWHPPENLDYIVLESGQHELNNGTIIEAGTFDCYDYIPSTETITFNTSFVAPPVVLAQIQTTNMDGFVCTRFTDLPSSTQFSTGLDTPQDWLNCVCDTHDALETIGWIAWPEETGFNGGKHYEVTRSSAIVTADNTNVSFTETHISSNNTYVTGLQSQNGNDLCVLRCIGHSELFVTLMVQEDICYDSETQHNNAESVGFILMEDDGSIYGIPVIPTATPTPECINDGDVNFSGTHSAEDAQIAFNIVLGLYSPTYLEECAADCNSSGSVTAEDAQTIFFSVLGTANCVDPL